MEYLCDSDYGYFQKRLRKEEVLKGSNLEDYTKYYTILARVTNNQGDWCKMKLAGHMGPKALLYKVEMISTAFSDKSFVVVALHIHM